jgi:hypothetical protein
MFRAVEISLARFKQYQQQAVEAGYINSPFRPSDTSTTSSSSLQESLSVSELSKDVIATEGEGWSRERGRNG